jgi:hypothetical protein
VIVLNDPGIGSADITVTTIKGQTIAPAITVNESQTALTIKNLPSGIYFLKVKGIGTKKLMMMNGCL